MGEDCGAWIVISPRTRRTLVMTYGILLLVATLAPLPRDAYEVVSTTGSDKVVHFVLFGGLTGIFLVLGWPTARLPAALAITMIAAALVEVVQSPLAYRTGDIWDFVAGSAGAVVVGVATRWGMRRVGTGD